MFTGAVCHWHSVAGYAWARVIGIEPMLVALFRSTDQSLTVDDDLARDSRVTALRTGAPARVGL
jgi:hypothetical protein